MGMMGSGIDAGPSRPPGPTPAMVPCNSSNGTNNNNGESNSWKLMSQDTSKMSKLREIVETSTSSTRKCVVDSILQQVNQLSDLEKLLLYLKLPIGRSPDPDPLKQPLNPLGSRSEVQLTITWIKTHLEINLDISLFKEDVYQEYLQYCENCEIKHLSKADFGKVMKQVFPSVRARRLGHRGDSKYTYSGLTKKFSVGEPILPDLSETASQQMEDLALDCAAGCVVLEWSEKMGNGKCTTIKDLALQLINKNLVDTRSVAAYTLLGDQRPDSTLGKHQLQRKLQEKEHMREQKRKLQDPPSELNRSSSERQKARRRSGAIKLNQAAESICSPLTSLTANKNLRNGNQSSSITDTSFSTHNNRSNTNSNGNVNILQNDNKTFGKIIGLPSIKQEKGIPSVNESCGGVMNSTGVSINQKTIEVDEETGDPQLHLGKYITNNNNSSNGNYSFASNITSTNMIARDSAALNVNNKFNQVPKVCDMNNFHFANNVNNYNNNNNCPSYNIDNLNNHNKHNGKNSNIWNQNYPTRIEDLEHTTDLNSSVNLAPQANSGANFQQAGQKDEFGSTLSSPMSEEQKLFHLRKILTDSNVGGQSSACVVPPNCLPINDDPLEFDNGGSASELRRRVSFQSPDGHMTGQNVMLPQNISQVAESTNRVSKLFNFGAINSHSSCDVQSQLVSHNSSANASPFMSPNNTPIYRSRNNSGQTSSTYVTPRSTPFTPDTLGHSENCTPFMSPAQTPQRSRHTSSQSARTLCISTSKSRHSSGTPFYYRHTPYQDELSGRKKSRNSSGNMPQSAPLSPLVHDSVSINSLQDIAALHSHHSSGDTNLHALLRKRSDPPLSSYDCRRRHASAGPTIPYQPQSRPPNCFNVLTTAVNCDPLSLEVSNVLGNQQPSLTSPSPTGPTNRPNSVPLPLMLNGGSGQEGNFIAKSYPTTPIVNQQFDFGQDYILSQPSSYTVTPVPSDFGDFPGCGLDLNPMIDGALVDQNAATSLASIDPSLPNLNNVTDLTGNLTQSIHPPNMNFQDSFNTENNQAFNHEDEPAHFMQNVAGTTFTSNSLVENVPNCGSQLGVVLSHVSSVEHTCQPVQRHTQDLALSGNSQITLNALNATQSLDLSSFENPSAQLEEDFSHSLESLGDQDDFNLVLDVSRD